MGLFSNASVQKRGISPQPDVLVDAENGKAYHIDDDAKLGKKAKKSRSCGQIILRKLCKWLVIFIILFSAVILYESGHVEVKIKPIDEKKLINTAISRAEKTVDLAEKGYDVVNQYVNDGKIDDKIWEDLQGAADKFVEFQYESDGEQSSLDNEKSSTQLQGWQVPHDVEDVENMAHKVKSPQEEQLQVEAVAEDNASGETTPEEPKTEAATPEEPKIEETTPEEPKAEETTPEEPKEEETTPEKPKEEETTPEEPKEEETTPEKPKEEETTPEKPKEEETTPEKPKEEETTPEAATPQETEQE